MRRVVTRVTCESDDGAKIYVSYRGVLRLRSEASSQAAGAGTATDEDYKALYFRTLPIFETGDDRYRWLNDIVTVAIGGVGGGGVKYEIFEVL